MTTYDTQLSVNPQALEPKTYGPRQQAYLNQSAFAQAKAEITSWPGYAQTPLIALDGLANTANIAKLWCKYEGARFGLASFKPTGPTYAMLSVLKNEVKKVAGINAVSTQDLLNRTYADITRNVVVSAVTSGNHGRALAWGAQLFGCRAVLYMNDGVSAGREAVIASFGGEVVRVLGAYDKAVQRSRQDAIAKGYFDISDHVAPTHPHVPRAIMQGYALVANEIIAQLASQTPPTHVFVPGGGGIFAGATCGHLWEHYGDNKPRVIVVEPNASCCLYESARQGQASSVGTAHSIMDGLVVETASPDPWEILSSGAFAFLTVPDQAAIDAMQQAANPSANDAPLVIGDTGSAALAGFLATTRDAKLRQQLGLSSTSRVVIIATEGATDPTLYQHLVGKTPEHVLHSAKN